MLPSLAPRSQLVPELSLPWYTVALFSATCSLCVSLDMPVTRWHSPTAAEAWIPRGWRGSSPTRGAGSEQSPSLSLIHNPGK